MFTVQRWLFVAEPGLGWGDGEITGHDGRGGPSVPLVEGLKDRIYSAGEVQDLQQRPGLEGRSVAESGEGAGDAVKAPTVEQGRAGRGILRHCRIGEEVLGEGECRIVSSAVAVQGAQIRISESPGAGVGGQRGHRGKCVDTEVFGVAFGGLGGVGPARADGVGLVEDHQGPVRIQGCQCTTVGGGEGAGQDIENEIRVQDWIGSPGRVDRCGLLGGQERQCVSYGGFTGASAAGDLDARWSPGRHLGSLVGGGTTRDVFGPYAGAVAAAEPNWSDRQRHKTR